MKRANAIDGHGAAHGHLKRQLVDNMGDGAHKSAALHAAVMRTLLYKLVVVQMVVYLHAVVGLRLASVLEVWELLLDVLCHNFLITDKKVCNVGCKGNKCYGKNQNLLMI